MIVVADASPLNYLIQIECEKLLRDLYACVLVPAAVVEELRHAGAPIMVARWMESMPEWIEIRRTTSPQDPALEVLDAGEREAIQLAEEQQADLLLIDERRGREEARRRGLATMGTLGVLLAAAERGLVDADAAFQQLIAETTFRASPEVRANFLRLSRETRDGRN
jgi:predicted nucleic acid-binding protein